MELLLKHQMFLMLWLVNQQAVQLIQKRILNLFLYTNFLVILIIFLPLNLQDRNIGVVNVQADDQLEQLHFDTRRAWNIKVTQIPCGCSDIETPKAPRGCLAYYTGFSGDLKSFNYDGFSCYR